VPLTADTIRQRFARGPLVLDGAMGTELERRRMVLVSPLWSATALINKPQVVLTIHRDYVAAGADIVVANTFRTNVRTLQRVGATAEGADLNELAVALARQAAVRATGRTPPVRPVLVAASIGPVEDCYHPERVPPDSDLQAEHGQMAAWLKAAAPDLIWIETMNTAREARVAAEGAAGAGFPFAVSFVVQESGDLLSGEALEDAVAAVEPFDPLAIGLNCIPPRGLTAILPRLRRATSRPLSAYAHINNPVPIRGWSYTQQVTPEEYAEYVREWLDAGARIVGGCCGTTPEHIRAVRKLVEQWG
jgi:S-methylmethionine-dependent homocysteine/selenocysteine methylase